MIIQCKQCFTQCAMHLKTIFSKSLFIIVALVFTNFNGFAQNRISIADEMALKNRNYNNAVTLPASTPRNITLTDGMRYTPSGTLAIGDPVFNRPLANGSGLSSVGTSVRYDAIPFVLACAQSITISFEAAQGGAIAPGNADTYLFLYGPAGFNPSQPLSNFVAGSDDDGALSLSLIVTAVLPAGNYTAVVTSFENVPGDFPWPYTLGIDGTCVFNGFKACINESITPITFTTIGATGIGTVTGMPMGVTAAWDADVLTISGIPTEAGAFNFNVPIIGGSTTAFSGVLNVGGIKNLTTNTCILTLQAAVNAAMDGDILVIAPGSYTENVTVNKNITFQFTADNDVTISAVTVATNKELKHTKSFNVTTLTNNGIYTGKGFAGKIINTGKVAPKQP